MWISKEAKLFFEEFYELNTDDTTRFVFNEEELFNLQTNFVSSIFYKIHLNEDVKDIKTKLEEVGQDLQQLLCSMYTLNSYRKSFNKKY